MTTTYNPNDTFKAPAAWEAGMIALERDPGYAPCCYLICRLVGEPGSLDWDTRDEENTVLIQTDWDWPGVARTFGWDGDDDDVSGAGDYLDDVAGAFVVVDDPGYFA